MLADSDAVLAIHGEHSPEVVVFIGGLDMKRDAQGLTVVHAAGSNTIQLALVGCGGRGTGAAINALSVKNGPMKLVVMADVVPAKLVGYFEWPTTG
jgi:hypothetical protein